jgi:hypothetical protein
MDKSLQVKGVVSRSSKELSCKPSEELSCEPSCGYSEDSARDSTDTRELDEQLEEEEERVDIELDREVGYSYHFRKMRKHRSSLGLPPLSPLSEIGRRFTRIYK